MFAGQQHIILGEESGSQVKITLTLPGDATPTEVHAIEAAAYECRGNLRTLIGQIESAALKRRDKTRD